MEVWRWFVRVCIQWFSRPSRWYERLSLLHFYSHNLYFLIKTPIKWRSFIHRGLTYMFSGANPSTKTSLYASGASTVLHHPNSSGRSPLCIPGSAWNNLAKPSCGLFSSWGYSTFSDKDLMLIDLIGTKTAPVPTANTSSKDGSSSILIW